MLLKKLPLIGNTPVRTALPVFCGLSHGILPRTSEVAAFIFLRLQKRELRTEVHPAQGHASGKGHKVLILVDGS